MKKLLCGLAVVAGLGSAVQANATAVLFDLAPTSSVLLTSYQPVFGGQPTLTSADLGSQSALLNAGQTWTINLFSIAFPLIGSGSGTISALLDFEKPAAAPDITNSANGSFFSFLITGGSLAWINQPQQYSLGDGTKYSVVFENLSGFTGRSVDVHAFLTLDSESVPEPGTVALLGLGMLAVILASRRQLLARKT
jgi:hypothetical protein